MQKTNIYVMILCLFTGLIYNSASYAAPPDSPSNLRTCDKVNPAGTVANPWFGWYVNDPDDQEIQTAWQILVSTNPEQLDKNTGNMWNSGKTESRKQNYLYYQGNPLNPGTRYFWKVRTWDKDNQSGKWSEISFFDTGLFTSTDWEGAKWIKRDTDEPDDYTYYRKQFSIEDNPIQRAIVYVTATHKYELYLNGKLIGKGPAYHYPQYHYYNGFDITENLTSGKKNLFACQTHWFGGGQGRPKGSRGFLLKTVIEFKDGSETMIGTDMTWKQSRVESLIAGQQRRNGEGIGYIEKIDGEKLIPDWNLISFDDSNWNTSIEIGSPPVSPWTGALQPDLTRVIEHQIKPVSVTRLSDSTYVIDFGKIYAGVPQITFSGGIPGKVIHMRGGFILNEDGTVSTEITQNTNMAYHFILNGKTAVFEPVEYLGMRYFQVDNSPNELNESNVSFTFRYYEMEPFRSFFTSSDSMLNQVWGLMKYSLIAGAQEQFVDTPTREKGGFLGDAWSQSVPAMTVMGDRAMTLRSLEEFLDSQDQYWEDGRLNAVYPNGDGQRDIPDYTQSFLVWAWDYYMQTGNVEFLTTHYNRLKNVADYVDAYRNKDSGLIHNLAGGRGPYEFGIIDWPAQMRYGYDMETEARTVVNVYAYMDFDIISKFAEILDNKDDQEIYHKKALNLKNAINSKLINKDGLYIDGLYPNLTQSPHVSQHANMFPLSAGIVPDKNYDSVVRLIKDRKMNVGMVTLRWLPESIGKAGQGNHLLKLYTNPEWDGWAQTIQQGGTVTWESWDAIDHNQSLSHPWGAVGLLGIQQYILGVEPLSPQYEHIQIKPLDFNGKLKQASGKIPTDRGDIYISWKRSDTSYALKVTLPDNCSARVYIPKSGTNDLNVLVNGNLISGQNSKDFILLNEIGSGANTFRRIVSKQN